MTAPASNSQYTGSLKGDADTISAPTYAYQVQESYTPPNGAPLGRTQTIMMPAFGGAFQPAPYKQSFRKFANPAPLGLCAFALTTFVLSMANANASGVKSPSIAIGAAYAYGGFVQLLAGMWEMAVGNTFGATALSSFGGFWIAWALIETEGLGLTEPFANASELNYAVGYFLVGWFIFAFLMLLCTLKSTLAFFSLFFFLDITFLLLSIAHFVQNEDGSANLPMIRAAGILGLITAFISWWNAMAGMLDSSNSFFVVPVLHFPWGEKVAMERKLASEAV